MKPKKSTTLPEITNLKKDRESIASFNSINSNLPLWHGELVNTEFNGEDKMISAYFNDKEQMYLAQTINLREDLETLFGEVECLTLKANGMWQSTIVYFKDNKSAKKILSEWNVLINLDLMCIIPTDCNINNLMTCDQYIAKLIGLSPSITAHDLILLVKKLRAKTCYISQTQT
ncbi:9205_t:CDS:2 [Diversispora eburnea]|uniref:9205_t:CDS:1 n=1 Tax=Diversispora eburnea TaxID=1213867 RepID=A0A9N9AIS0_9GLOM|nr:9205_t:CDS:2 [Diversispora eburnea]